MRIYSLSDMKGGWFAGAFFPSVFWTGAFEAGYKIHRKGEPWPVHYHKVAYEITLLVRGRMWIQGQLVEAGEVFVVPPGEIADPEFLEDCEVVVIKTPSVPGDKYEV